jgi:hypothetical protein
VFRRRQSSTALSRTKLLKNTRVWFGFCFPVKSISFLKYEQPFNPKNTNVVSQHTPPIYRAINGLGQYLVSYHTLTTSHPESRLQLCLVTLPTEPSRLPIYIHVYYLRISVQNFTVQAPVVH